MFRWPWRNRKPTTPSPLVFAGFASPAPEEQTGPWLPPRDLSEVTNDWYPGAVFRRFYEVLTWSESTDLAGGVLAAALPILKPFVDALAPFRQLADSPPDLADIENGLWDLYALNRINDFLLMHFQRPVPGVEQPAKWNLGQADLSHTAYQAFMEALGFVEIAERPFHPFFHEITEVMVDATLGAQALIERTDWPGYMFGELLFSRAGVVLRVGPEAGVGALAATSHLYFTFQRRFRPTRDLSMGWGSNSQWRTSFRRDYLSDGRMVFNADGRYLLDEDYPNYANAEAPEDGAPFVEDGLSLEDRIALLRHRGLILTGDDHSEYWPYDDHFIEAVDSAASTEQPPPG